jgi:glycosyltransferase involved in cell wall biosynthesis
MAGPGDAIRAHGFWKQGRHDPTEVSLTFSGQIEDYCRDAGAGLFIMAYHARRDILHDGDTTIEHAPKFWPNSRGVAYHLRELLYGLLMLRSAVRFRADVAILDSGCTQYFWQSLFALFGMKVVPVLHNSLWPNGFKPNGLSDRFIRTLDRVFFRRIPEAVLCVSPACARQTEELAGSRHPPLVQIRAQFDPEFFAQIPSPPPHSKAPFTIMFIGRIVASKGVFDILEMARRIDDLAPGRVRWIVCGTGHDFDALNRRAAELHLGSVVQIRGWTSLEELASVYTQSHCAIVPTRSSFTEGLAMSAVEAVLAGRPVITNPVVPALEIVGSAAVACETNNLDSYVGQIFKLINDPRWYNALVGNCAGAGDPFLDRSNGIAAALKSVLG